jgi:hypothetical protein
MCSRLETLSTAVVFVGLQTPAEQFMFLVAAEDILTLAAAGAARSTTDAAAPTTQMPMLPQSSHFLVDFMVALPWRKKAFPAL